MTLLLMPRIARGVGHRFPCLKIGANGGIGEQGCRDNENVSHLHLLLVGRDNVTRVNGHVDRKILNGVPESRDARRVRHSPESARVAMLDCMRRERQRVKSAEDDQFQHGQPPFFSWHCPD